MSVPRPFASEIRRGSGDPSARSIVTRGMPRRTHGCGPLLVNQISPCAPMFSPCRPPRACSALAVPNWGGEAADRDAAGADDLGDDGPALAFPAVLAQPESRTIPTR